MTNRMVVLLGACALTGLAACNDPTQPAEQSVSLPALTAAAAAQEFTIRKLGTLGGAESFALSINEPGEVVGASQLPSGNYRAFLWRAGQGMRSLGTLGGAHSRARGI